MNTQENAVQAPVYSRQEFNDMLSAEHILFSRAAKDPLSLQYREQITGAIRTLQSKPSYRWTDMEFIQAASYSMMLDLHDPSKIIGSCDSLIALSIAARARALGMAPKLESFIDISPAPVVPVALANPVVTSDVEATASKLLHDANATIEDLRKEVEGLQAANTHLREKAATPAYSGADDQVEVLQKEVEELEMERDQQTSVVISQRMKITDLENKVTTLLDERDQLRVKISDLGAEVDQLKAGQTTCPGLPTVMQIREEVTREINNSRKEELAVASAEVGELMNGILATIAGAPGLPPLLKPSFAFLAIKLGEFGIA